MLNVIKADGVTEPFEETKLISSLLRAGVEADTAKYIAQEVKKSMFDGITTNEVYSLAFKFIRNGNHTAARYSLKRAILEFGPSGFPFETYLAEIFRAQGHNSATGQIIQGACVEHEVDVVVETQDYTRYVEAKFHNSLGFKTDLKVALYVKARIDDLRQNTKTPAQVRGMLATNTKFTDKAIQFAECSGVELLSWDYPNKGNLHDLIDSTKIYPITALTALSRREKQTLLEERIVLCNNITDRGDALARAGIKGKHADTVFAEAAGLCVPGKGI